MEYNIKGEIGIWGLAICKVVVQNSNDASKVLEVNAVIDTGAYDYCISQKAIDFLELPTVGEDSLGHPIIGIQKTGIYKVNILFEPDILIDNVMCKVLVMENYPVEFIIGTSFLKGKSFTYNTLLGSWRIIW